MYTSEQANNYVKFKEQFNETDKELFNVLAVVAIQGKDVLDLGCGDGRYSAHLKDLGAHSVAGIDVSDKMIGMANKNYHGGDSSVHFSVADGRNMPFPDASFDLVFSNFVIHYFENVQAVFKEIARVLRPNGYFIGTFNVADVIPGYESLYNTNMPIRLGNGEKSVVVQNLIKSRKEVSDALVGNNLEVVTEKEIEHPNAIIDPEYKDFGKVKKHVICILVRKSVK